jgi:hypothetical protein
MGCPSLADIAKVLFIFDIQSTISTSPSKMFHPQTQIDFVESPRIRTVLVKGNTSSSI